MIEPQTRMINWVAVWFDGDVAVAELVRQLLLNALRLRRLPLAAAAGVAAAARVTLRMSSSGPIACSVAVFCAAAVGVAAQQDTQRHEQAQTAARDAVAATTQTGTRSRFARAASAWPCQRGERSRITFGPHPP